MPVLIGFGIYLGLGIIVLGIFDILTKRVRARFMGASQETEGRMIEVGQSVGHKTAIALTAGALWLFWVVALYAALTKTKEDKPRGQEG